MYSPGQSSYESSDESNYESSDNDNISPSIAVIEPYQFEPRRTVEYSSSDEDQDMADSETEETETRVGNKDWCNCGNCEPMPREVESVCCKEIDKVQEKFLDLTAQQKELLPTDHCSCIVNHPGFEGVCLNLWVLEAAWYQYKQYYSEPHEGPLNRRNRHVAYRQLVRWCWKFLGKEVRVPLPSCAVTKIRRTFPLEDPESESFEGFHYCDE